MAETAGTDLTPQDVAEFDAVGTQPPQAQQPSRALNLPQLEAPDISPQEMAEFDAVEPVIPSPTQGVSRSVAKGFGYAGNVAAGATRDIAAGVQGDINTLDERQADARAGRPIRPRTLSYPLAGNLPAALAGEPQPMEAELKSGMEEAKARGEWLPQAMARGSESLVKTAPKMAAVALAGPSMVAQALAGGSLFGLDDEGNFNPMGAVFGALLPGVGLAGRKLAAVAIGKVLASGTGAALTNPIAQKVLETVGEQAALNAFAATINAPDLVQKYQEDPAEFKATLAEMIGSNMAFALMGVHRLGKEVPSETQNWIRKNADTLAAKKIIEQYSPQDLRDIYDRVNRADPSVTQAEKDLVVMVNEQIEKPGQAIRKGVNVVQQDWPTLLAKAIGVKAGDISVEVPGEAITKQPRRGRTLALPEKGADAIDNELLKSSAAEEPEGAIGERKEDQGGGVRDSVAGPAGQSEATGSQPAVSAVAIKQKLTTLTDEQAQDFGPATPTPAPTVPELPETITAQLQMLQEGKRNVVMITPGEKLPPPIKDFRMVRTEQGAFIYNPATITKEQIQAASDNDALGDIIGYGIPRKPAKGTEIGAWVVRTKDGIEKHAVLTDAQHSDSVKAAAQRMMSPGDTLGFEQESEVLARRQPKAPTQPIIAYHQTPFTFDKFNPWSHFSASPEGAAAVWNNWKKDIWEPSQGEPQLQTHRVKLTINNPLRVEDETDAAMDPDGWAWIAAEKLKALGKTVPQYPSAENMIPVLKHFGYDGLVYLNQGEGGGDSYVILSGDQVENAISKRRPQTSEPDHDAGGLGAKITERYGLAPGQWFEMAKYNDYEQQEKWGTTRAKLIERYVMGSAKAPSPPAKSEGYTEPNPSDKQIEAGNAPKRKVSVHGLEISIENEAGGIRRSKPDAKQAWEVTMPAAYGYIRGTKDNTGEQVDVYLGPNPESQRVWVINQVDPETRKFDEPKVLMGFDKASAAVAAYEGSFSDGKGEARMGKIKEFTIEQFKEWLKKPRELTQKLIDKLTTPPARDVVPIEDASKPTVEKPAEKPIEERIRQIIFSSDNAQIKSGQMRKLAQEQGVSLKEMQETIEAQIVVEADKQIRQSKLTPDELFRWMVSTYDKQPIMSARTSESVEGQKYSTPIPLSYAMGYAVGITPQTGTYDATGGNGALLMGSDLEASQGNEMDPQRRDALKKLGVGTVTPNDATKYTPSTKFPIVQLNPPFGTIPNTPYAGFRITKLEHLIALKALEAMEDNGAATLILGAKRQEGEVNAGGAQWIFENYLYGHYNVVANFEVSGDLYGRQGAKWPVRVIAIIGRKQNPVSGQFAPKTVERLNTWDEVWNKAKEIKNDIDRARQTVGPDGQTGISLHPAGESTAGPGELPAGSKRPVKAPSSGGKPQTGGVGKPPAGGPPAGGDAGVATGQPPAGSGGTKPATTKPGPVGDKDAGVEGGLPGGTKAPANVPGGSLEGGAGSKSGNVSGKAGLDDLSGVSDSDIDSLIDESVAEQSKPKAAPKPKGVVQNISKKQWLDKIDELEGRGPGPAKRPPSIPKEKPPTPKDLGKKAIGELGDVGKETFKALDELFGKGGNLGTGPGFDEKTYAKAKPHFQKAWDDLKKAGKTLKDFINAVIKQWGEAVKAYLKRFIQDMQAEQREPPLPKKAKGDAPKVVGNEFQATYEPMSQGEPFGTLTPKNIAAGQRNALEAMVKKVGPIDEYLANRLNMDVDEVRSVLAAEQIDGAALAIHQMENGGALIIGDQTGIGKGRQAAAVIRYAILNGKIPVFFTKDPKLFTDMYGDLKDIHTQVKPLILGSPEKASIVNEQGEVIVKSPGLDRQRREMENILESGMEEAGYNAIFATYSQVNERNARQQFLERLAEENGTIVIMDEAHEAAGDSDTSMQAAFFTGGTVVRGSGATQTQISVPGLLSRRGTYQPMGGGVLYLSATFAKRADNMPVYFRTDLHKAAQSFPQIVDAMKRGGVAMQQAVSEALAKGGQYLRRERSFAGVRYDTVLINPPDLPKLVEQVDEITDVLSEILGFSAAIKAWNAASTAMTGNQSTMTDFASIVHNQISQLLLAAKADSVVDAMIASKKKGEKPLVALMNTMESFLDNYVLDMNIKPGQSLSLRWNELLKYALSRCLRQTERLGNGDTEISYIPVDDLPPMIRALYDQITEAADAVSSNFPISPIDYIIQKSGKAGVTMAELTGRTSGLEYVNFETGEALYRKFKRANKNTVVNAFNNGTYDGMLLNAAGSTGLSAHASQKVDDKRPRNLHIAQPALDINVFMQTLGRIFRTGMVETGVERTAHLPEQYQGSLDKYQGTQMLGGPPYHGQTIKESKYGARYTHLVLPLQAETRPAAMAAKKMKSLNANVTAESGNAIKIEAEDIFNKYGDLIVSEFLDEHPDIRRRLGLDIDHNQDGTVKVADDIARKFTGRLQLMPDFEQAQVFASILPSYRQLVEQLKATGDYDLEIAIHDDWDGIQLSDDQLAAGTDESSIFTAGLRMQRWEIKDNRHVPSGKEMQEEFERRSGSSDKVQTAWVEYQAKVDEFLAKQRADLEAAKAELISQGKPPTDPAWLMVNNAEGTINGFQTRWDATRTKIDGFADRAGDVVTLANNETGDTYEAMLVELRMPNRVSSAASGFRLRYAINAPGGVQYLNGASFSPSRWEQRPSVNEPEDLEGGNKGNRYARYFVVGNPIRAYDVTGGRGKMVRFKAQDGHVVSGLLMPRNWGPQNLANDPRLDLVNGTAAAHYIRNNQSPIEAGNIVRVGPVPRDYQRRTFIVSTSAARRTGGPIFLDEQLRALTGQFTKVGNRMTATFEVEELPQVIDRIMAITKNKFRPVVSGSDTTQAQNDVAESNKQSGRQASLATVPPKELGGPGPLPTYEARSVDELRAMLPHVGLPAQSEALLREFLNLPLIDKLPAFRTMIADALDGGFQGTKLQDLVSIARNADPLTGPHELLHIAWDILPDDVRAELERMRVASLNQLIREAQDAGKPETVHALEDIRDNPTSGGDEFLSRTYPAALRSLLYPYSSAEEFFTHSGSERFKQKVGSTVEGFWARVKQILSELIGAIKRALKLKPNQAQFFDDILAGRFKSPTAEQVVNAERQGSLTPEEQKAEMDRLLDEAEQLHRIPTMVLGEPYYVRSREQLDPAAGQEVAKTMLDAAGIPATEKIVTRGTEEFPVWQMTPQGRDMTAEGEKLLDGFKQALAQSAPGKASQDLGAIINAIRLNFEAQNSAMNEMQPWVRVELWAAAQSDASARGLALRSLMGVRDDLITIGRNVDTELGKIWSDAMGGDAMRRVLDDLKAAKAEIERLKKLQGLGPGRGPGTGTPDQQAEIDRLKKALDDAVKKHAPGKRSEWGSGTKMGKRILELIQAGQGKPWDVLKAMAPSHGFKTPADEDLANMKRWADKLDEIAKLTDEEAAGKTDEQQEQALRLKQAALSDETMRLRKQIETKWNRLAKPYTIRTRAGRENITSAVGDYVSANLLAKIGFATRQTIDVGTQMALYTPTSAVAHALMLHEQAVAEGTRSRADVVALFKDLSISLGEAYKARAKALRAAFDATGAVISGANQGRNVAQMFHRISIYDKAIQRAEELDAKGEHTKAWLLKFMTLHKIGYTVSQALDQFQGVPLVHQEMRQQVVRALRENGLTPAEAEAKADYVMGDPKRDEQVAIAEATLYLQGAGIEVTKRAVAHAAWRIAQAKAYERIRTLGLNADDFYNRNMHFLETQAWNMKEEGGLGGAAAEIMRVGAKTARKLSGAGISGMAVGIPLTAVTRFGNAIGIMLNRKLTWAGLGFNPGWFGVDEMDLDENGVARAGSPFYKYPEQRKQRKVEAAAGLTSNIALLLLAAAGVIVVRLAWPKSKAERDHWDKMGWKPGQVDIPTGPDTHIRLSMNVGPLAVFSPGLSAGGALHDLSEQEAKAQAKLNEEAEKNGLEPGKIRGRNLGDYLGVAANAAMAGLTSGRTISGLLSSFSEQGNLNVSKSAASFASSVSPYQPGLQELLRMVNGTVLDARTASVWDFFMPLPSSGSARVNMLGDQVGSTSGLQRTVEVLTGGNNLLPINDKAREGAEAYQALFASGYRPPAIDPNRAYNIDGTYRPLTNSELQRYTVARGQALKQELSDLGPDATAKMAGQAYQRANRQALQDVGVTTGSSGRGQGSAPSSPGQAASPGAVQSSVGASGGLLGGRGRLPGGVRRPRGGSLRGPSVRGARGPSVRAGRGLRLSVRGPRVAAAAGRVRTRGRSLIR